MARIKRGVTAHAKHKKVLKAAKGYYGSKSTLYKTANEAVIKSMTYSYIGRKRRKRDFRQLWIARINAASRQNGLSYSKFMHGLKKANINMNRKMLSEMAINDPSAFAQLVEIAKNA
ncbi:50S ribosomal protein L20 [Miniphocaeibacter halophilus]|uniref:50S ribosomal protein L20 n=1 Tax=Miniphocaeibacter halophilus TaxID=2931922 RepID=A0AC61MT81_9FIRM|nr:50S ribosomal protein L20 [Miniphocaeibacter halophilus]QQK07518.1 50S ribosomal protein L20 [Miniphocaeibacter halophilus]